VSVSDQQSRVWQRAAVYGSLWAAVEIVVGSFLHNLRMPFAGAILSAFGVTVMTAGHRASPERGLIWRAALICALMKSISPSAVILGPMVGIAMEGVLLEASVRLLRGHPAGYLVGGALAVSWPLAQRILNAMLALGPDVVRLYVEAYNFASRALGVSRFGPFDLIATLVVGQAAFGVAAAALGLRVGRDAREAPALPGRPNSALAIAGGAPVVAKGGWSVRRLALASAALLVGMLGLAKVPLWFGFVYVAGFAALVLRTYPRAVARIRRPSWWIELAFVMLLAGALLGGARSGLGGLASGVSAGAAMVLRATMVLLGFSAISVELRNPSILSWVERRRLRGLSDALGAAFGTLPAFTAALSQQRREWRHPRRLLTGLIQLANRLTTVRPGRSVARRCVILRGETGSGKTTLAREVVARLRGGGHAVAGILAPGRLEDGRRTGFDLVDLATGESTVLARETTDVGGVHPRWSRFAFSPEGLALGQRALGRDAHGADVVVVDEVGPFELAGGGWARSLDDLARDFHGSLLLVARGTIVEAVLARWGSPDTVVYDVDQGSPDRIASLLSG
jgi:nucleoside-triphosphatase THEP1